MNGLLKHVAVCLLLFTLTVTSSTLASASAQTTGDAESARQWCENKKDELKDHLTDLILSVFAADATYDMTTDIRDNGNALAAEPSEKMTDCADFYMIFPTELMLEQAS